MEVIFLLINNISVSRHLRRKPYTIAIILKFLAMRHVVYIKNSYLCTLDIMSMRIV